MGVCWFHGENQTCLQVDAVVSSPPRRNPGRVGRAIFNLDSMSLKWWCQRRRKRGRYLAAMKDAPTLLRWEGFVLSMVESKFAESAVVKDAPTILSVEESVSGTGQNKKHAGIEDAPTM